MGAEQRKGIHSSTLQEARMDFGYFAMPSHPPERSLREGHEWDLQVLRWLDELDYAEAWIGEHHTAPWEPHPSPDLLVVEGFRQTEKRYASVPVVFCCPTTIRRSWPTGSPCWTTFPAAA